MSGGEERYVFRLSNESKFEAEISQVLHPAPLAAVQDLHILS